MASTFGMPVLQRFAGHPPQTNLKNCLPAYRYVPRSWLHNDENPTSIALAALDLFNLQAPALYFEIDSSIDNSYNNAFFSQL